MAHPHAIPITLSEADRSQLQGWVRRRKTGQALATRARIVLACAAPGSTNGGVAAALGVSRPTVALWRRRFAERGLEGLLDEPRPGAPRKITDEQVEQAVTGQGHGPEPDRGLPNLARLRLEAAPGRHLQALQGPALRRKGARHRRPLPGPARPCPGAVRGREAAGPGRRA